MFKALKKTDFYYTNHLVIRNNAKGKPLPAPNKLNCKVFYGLKLENTNVSFLCQLAAFPKHLNTWTERCELKAESSSFTGGQKELYSPQSADCRTKLSNSKCSGTPGRKFSLSIRGAFSLLSISDHLQGTNSCLFFS